MRLNEWTSTAEVWRKDFAFLIKKKTVYVLSLFLTLNVSISETTYVYEAVKGMARKIKKCQL